MSRHHRSNLFDISFPLLLLRRKRTQVEYESTDVMRENNICIDQLFVFRCIAVKFLGVIVINEIISACLC